MELPDIPKELIDLLKPKKTGPGPSKVPDKIKAGERNDQLFRQACSLREKGMTQDELFRTLEIFNETRCEVPLAREELVKIAESAAKFEKGSDVPKKGRKRLLQTLLQVLQKDEKTYRLFGYNEFTNDTEFLKAPPWDPLVAVGSTINDIDMISLKVYLSMHHAFEPPTGSIGEAIAYEASNYKYHPVRDFINKLVWDKKERLSTWLITGAGAEDNVYVRAVARKVLVAAVARVFNPGCMFQYMLVLEGEQGIGKSWLVSILGGKWFTELNITEEDKDVVEYMRGRWIIEVPEMVCARKTEVDHLKAFITKTKDRVRLAYRRNATDFHRQSILIGTINPSGDNSYLRDDTGGRRFWPVMCGSIDINWMKANRDQLIAEAFEVYKSGTEELHLTDPEVLMIAKERQEERQQEDVWTQYIKEYMATLAPGKGFTIGDVGVFALKFKEGQIDRSSQTRIGIILRKMGVPFKREGTHKIRMYYPEGEKKHEKMGADWTD